MSWYTYHLIHGVDLNAMEHTFSSLSRFRWHRTHIYSLSRFRCHGTDMYFTESI